MNEREIEQAAREFFPQMTPACGQACVLAVLANRRKAQASRRTPNASRGRMPMAMMGALAGIAGARI